VELQRNPSGLRFFRPFNIAAQHRNKFGVSVRELRSIECVDHIALHGPHHALFAADVAALNSASSSAANVSE
jgi:hypothetical protein